MQISSVADAIAAMTALEGSTPASDGLAAFNRMYLGVTQDVATHIGQQTFADGDRMATLDVTFANLYFAAVDAATARATIPVAWRPLFERRATAGIEPIQFALAGMNAHINHDLPVAVIATCHVLGITPTAPTFHDDYQRVDALLDGAEQAVRQSFESGTVLADDRHHQAVIDLLGGWSIDAARDVAWQTASALWRVRHDQLATTALLAALGRTVAMASRVLLTPL